MFKEMIKWVRGNNNFEGFGTKNFVFQENLTNLYTGMDKVQERGAPLPGNDKEN